MIRGEGARAPMALSMRSDIGPAAGAAHPGELGLVAAIDREAVRFALVELTGGSAPFDIVRMPVQEHSTFTGAVEAYLSRMLPGGWPRRVAIAIAGVPVGDVVSATGGSWYLSMRGIEGHLRSRPVLLNDFAAAAFALPCLPATSFRALNLQPSIPDRGTLALVGPLAGLGTAGLVRLGGTRAAVIQSEAGHTGIVPVDEEEHRFIDAVRGRSGTVTAEDLLSESGMVRAFEFVSGQAIGSSIGITPTRIVAQAQSGEATARRATGLFVRLLGSYCRTIVMTLGSWHGLFLSGPLARLLVPELAGPEFRSRIAGTDRYRRRLAEVPLAVVMEKDLDLRGAAAALLAD